MVGLRTRLPHRERPGRPLLPGEKSDNAEHLRVPARVEHAFARLKHYDILCDCCPTTGLCKALQTMPVGSAQRAMVNATRSSPGPS